MSPAIDTGIAGVGVLGPGLADWADAQTLLRQPGQWVEAPTQVGAPMRLPATERRRAGLGVKASIAVAEQACAMAGIDPALPRTVFTSATGDPANCHALCEALALPERLVSPTRFTNSVHNATAGYWHIALHSRRASTSLAAFDASTEAGLLEAAVQCASTQEPVLLVACDLPYPEPLRALRPLPDVFAFALLLLPSSRSAIWHMRLSLGAGAPATHCDAPALEALRRAIPAARVLPLLAALAAGQAATVHLADDGGPGLSLALEPRP